MYAAIKRLFICCGILVLSMGLAYSQTAGNIKGKAGVPGYSPSLFYYVLTYRTALELPEYIIDTINARAATAKALEISDPDFNIRKYERSILKYLLTDNQYGNLLVYKNTSLAKELTSKVWTEMLKQHLIYDSSDILLYKRINAHLLTSLVTREYFIDDPEEQRKNLDELENQAPSSLYKYYHHGYTKPVVRNLYRATPVW